MKSAQTLDCDRRLRLTGGLPRGVAKITAEHHQRLVVVYVRQSNPQQVLDHRESTDLQYALRDLAVALGWAPERVMIIDDDLGKTARLPDTRSGFERLFSEVALKHVGLILGVEMSRLARNHQDWYRLFDCCAVVDTLLADRDGVYDATDPNDRMLLGLKGIMSEMELHTMRGRLERGRLNKAARGALFIALPIGYLVRPDGAADMDPDEEVRAVVRLVLQKFDELGTAYAVFAYLRQHGIRLPIRPHTGPNRGRLEWRDATLSTVSGMLRHPTYAGAYVYGRRRQVLRPDGSKTTGRLPRDQWKVFLPDTLPAYISWEKYLENQQRLARNRSGPETPGTPRGGVALLGGRVVCGRCGRRLQVHYHGRGPRDVYYECERAAKLGLTESCHGIKASVLDELVARQVLTALEPASLQLSLEAAADVERERQRLHEHWRKRRDRAAYEASRAERQYQLVEPENRLVARTLEASWETLLREQRRVQEEYARFRADQPLPPTPHECAAIRRLAWDIPALWHGAEMTHAERTELLRCLLDQVQVTVAGNSERVDVTLHWAGGFLSQQEVIRPVNHYTQLREYDRLLQRLTELRHSGSRAEQVAEQLHAEGFRPARRDRFTAAMVRQLWSRSGRSDLSAPEWHLPSLSRHLNVPESRLREWLRRGWLSGRKSGGTWIAWADATELSRLSQLSSYQREHGRFHSYATPLITPKAR